MSDGGQCCIGTSVDADHACEDAYGQVGRPTAAGHNRSATILNRGHSVTFNFSQVHSMQIIMTLPQKHPEWWTCLITLPTRCRSAGEGYCPLQLHTLLIKWKPMNKVAQLVNCK